MRDHDVIQAIARKLGDTGCPHPDAVAAEVMAIIRGRGYKLIPGQADDWQHHGAGLPTPGSEAAELLAKAKATLEAAP